jgi:anaerobic selenocysteine-containing dehydrogenase
METFIIDVSRYLNLPGYGDNAIPGKNGKFYPLKKAEDYYLRGIANLAFNAGVEDASEKELEEVEKNYPVAKHKDVLSGKEWRKVCTILLKGGVFKSDRVLFDENGNFKSKVREICVWNEKLGTSTDSLTGKKLWGTLKYVRATDYLGNRVDKLQGEFRFNLISYKSALHTQSRTICYRQALVYEPDFSLKIHPTDAAALNLRDGDRVRVTSPSNRKGFITTVKVTELVRPGVVAYSHHFGHWQHGASSFYIENGREVLLGGNKVVGEDGWVVPDERRKVGIPVNALTYLDSEFYNLPLLETFSGIPDFSSTRVKIEKV